MDTLTRMRAFIEVVEAEGFSAAARKIGRSKALLSKYVRELEDELGALLLNRTTRQFSLTEAGHTYYKRAKEIVLEIQLDDRFVDLVEEGFDLAVRITRLENSSLIARRLSPFTIKLCASPELIEK